MPEDAYAAARLPEPRLRARSGQPGAEGPLGLALLCLLALAGLWGVAHLVPAAHLRDAIALRDFTLLGYPHIETVATFLVRLLEPLPFAIYGGVLVGIALARERPRIAVAVAAVMTIAPLTAEALKPMLALSHPAAGELYTVAASWPSGHATAALTVALCAVLVAPTRLRPPIAAIGLIYALSVGVSLLILAWHMPSDVLGGYLLASLWTALAVASLRAGERRWPVSRRTGLRRTPDLDPAIGARAAPSPSRVSRAPRAAPRARPGHSAR